MKGDVNMAEEVKNIEVEEKTKETGTKSFGRDLIWLVTGFIVGFAIAWCIFTATLSSSLKQLDSYINQMNNSIEVVDEAQ